LPSKSTSDDARTSSATYPCSHSTRASSVSAGSCDCGYLPSTDAANVSSSYSPVDAPVFTERRKWLRDAFLGAVVVVLPPALRVAQVWPRETRYVVGVVIVPSIVADIGADDFEFAR